MRRSIAFVLLAAFTTPLAAQQLASVSTPALRPAVVVSDEIVRIGDFIDNAGAASDIAIFRAPDFGQTGIVAAARVIEAARQHHVFAVDARNLAEIAVTRASRPIAPKAIEAHILRFFAGQHGLGRAEDLAITFDRELQTIHIEPASTAELQVVRGRFDPRNNRFDVMLTVPDSAVMRRNGLRYAGTLFEAVDVAIVARPVARGDLVTQSDITIARRPKAQVARDAIAPTEPTVGLAARQPLRPGQVLRHGDLTKAEMIRRNDIVTLTYEVPGIHLTMRAKALEAGAEGDVISVLNLQSNRTIQGAVKGPGLVSVTRNVASAPPAAVATISPTRRAE